MLFLCIDLIVIYLYDNINVGFISCISEINSRMMNVTDLPAEILLVIFKYLSCGDLFGVLPFVCSLFEDVVSIFQIESLDASVTNCEDAKRLSFKLEVRTLNAGVISGCEKPSELFLKHVGKSLICFNLNLSCAVGSHVCVSMKEIQSLFMPLFTYAKCMKEFNHNGLQKVCEWDWGLHDTHSSLNELQFRNIERRAGCYVQKMFFQRNGVRGNGNMNVLVSSSFVMNRKWNLYFPNVKEIMFDFSSYDEFFYGIEYLKNNFGRLNVLKLNCLCCHWGSCLGYRMCYILQYSFSELHTWIMGICDEGGHLSNRVKHDLVSKMIEYVPHHVKVIELKTIKVDIFEDDIGYKVLSSIVVRSR